MMVPRTPLKWPLIVVNIMCLLENLTCARLGSICQILRFAAPASLYIAMSQPPLRMNLQGSVCIKNTNRGNHYNSTMYSDTSRSEEHTSELQSHLNLVCR